MLLIVSRIIRDFIDDFNVRLTLNTQISGALGKMFSKQTLVITILLGAAVSLILLHLTDRNRTVSDAILRWSNPTANFTRLNEQNVISSRYYVDSVVIGNTKRHLYNVYYYPDLDIDLDNMNMEPLPFLPDHKNPCWYEPLPVEGPYPKEQNILTTIFHSLDKFIKKSQKFYGRRNTLVSIKDRFRIRCIPYYYIIGVSKCGSSDLNTILNKHEDVIGPPKKEVTFWNRLRYSTPQIEQNPAILRQKTFLSTRDMWPLRQYMDVYDWNAIKIESNYRTIAGERFHHIITGDATPNYIWHFDGWRKVAANKGETEPKVIMAHLIKKLTPQAKIIVMIRDPIKRLMSEYNFFKAKEKKSPEHFHRLVLEAIKVWDNCTAQHTAKYCAYDEWTNSQTFPVRLRLGLYYLFIRDWYEVFGDQFLLLKLEDYAESRSSVTDKIFDFLQIERLPPKIIDNEHIHNANSKSKTYMNKQTEDIVKEFYKPWNEKLGKIMRDSDFDYNTT